MFGDGEGVKKRGRIGRDSGEVAGAGRCGEKSGRRGKGRWGEIGKGGDGEARKVRIAMGRGEFGTVMVALGSVGGGTKAAAAAQRQRRR